MSNSQLNKLISAIKDGTEATLSLSSNFIGNSNNETNFSHKLLLPNTQVLKIRETFANGSSANVKFSKTKLSKIVQQGGFIFAPPNILDTSVVTKTPFELAGPIISSFRKNTKT